MGATPCAMYRVSSVDCRFRKISNVNFGDMQKGPKKDFSAPKVVSCDYDRGPSRRINLHVGVGAAILAPTIDANLYVRYVSRLSKAKGF